MQSDDMGRKRVVCYQLRKMEPTKKKYPVHDKELLAFHIECRVQLLGERTFALYTDHASLRNSDKESASVLTDGTLAFLLF